ncbi:MAG: terpene cyclase/mutase family protein, partial [Planctomycetes bacterium]|nr:terpene cyclase/mutase family protein [Planctomycetota bacterium]
QASDGSWGAASFSLQCGKEQCSGSGGRDYDSGVTGLALLAFLGAGFSHLSRDEFPDPVRPGKTLHFGNTVRNAIKWLVAQQDAEGCIGPRRNHYIYNHSIAALALSEAYGMTNAGMLAAPAQKAIDFLVAAQNPGNGWRYTPRCTDNDTSVTGWAAMALKSAEISGLNFPKECYEGTRAWLDQVTEPTYSRAGYMGKPGNGRERWLSPTAIAIMSRIFMDKNKADPRLSNGCDQLLKFKPEWEEGKIDFYFWYYGSLALFQFDGPAGPKWRAWNEDMKNALVKNQNALSTGCRTGSWEPVDLWARHSGGRVYATAINALTLEVYYRYANVFGAR